MARLGQQDFEKIQAKSLGNVVFERLEEMILSREIQPGERINESQLAVSLGVSRGPIREACRQLERHGMVEVFPRKGTFVREIDITAVEDLYEIRAVLDQYAGEKAASRIDEHNVLSLAAYIDEMKEAVSHDDPRRYFQINLAFHNAIFSISGNQELPYLYEGLIKRSILFRKTSLSLPGRLERSLAHHTAIFQALRNKDSKRAGRLMKEHVIDAKNILLKSYGKSL